MFLELVAFEMTHQSLKLAELPETALTSSEMFLFIVLLFQYWKSSAVHKESLNRNFFAKTGAIEIKKYVKYGGQEAYTIDKSWAAFETACPWLKVKVIYVLFFIFCPIRVTFPYKDECENVIMSFGTHIYIFAKRIVLSSIHFDLYNENNLSVIAMVVEDSEVKSSCFAWYNSFSLYALTLTLY